MRCLRASQATKSRGFGAKEKTHTFFILFKGAFSIINSPQNITVNESGSASFFCNATSYPPEQDLATHITWSKLGDSGKVFPSGQQLVLDNVDHRDAGTYVCKATNGLGLPDTAAAVLSVLCK